MRRSTNEHKYSVERWDEHLYRDRRQDVAQEMEGN